MKSSAHIFFAALAFCTAAATSALTASPASVGETGKGKTLVDG